MFKILGEDKQMVERLQPERMRAEVCMWVWVIKKGREKHAVQFAAL